jgi:hypothetical protein
MGPPVSLTKLHQYSGVVGQSDIMRRLVLIIVVSREISWAKSLSGYPPLIAVKINP